MIHSSKSRPKSSFPKDVKKLFNWNSRLKRSTILQICKLHLIFLSAIQKQPSIAVLRKSVLKIPKRDFNKVAAYFHNTFSEEHLWTAASDNSSNAIDFFIYFNFFWSLKLKWCHAPGTLKIASSDDDMRVWNTNFLHAMQLPNILGHEWDRGLHLMYEGDSLSHCAVTEKCDP